jgi:cysteine-rich repeat protein
MSPAKKRTAKRAVLASCAVMQRGVNVLPLLIGLAAVALGGPLAIRAQAGTFDLSWYAVAGGGAMFIEGGGYRLSSTVGQPNAGLLTTTPFGLTGGFWALAGASVCGDGLVSGGEQCDDGNRIDGDCCSSDCRYEPAGQVCNDGHFCTVGETCLSGACGEGSPRDCTDTNACTMDRCEEQAARCVNDPAPLNGRACDDGLFCTVAEKCLEGKCGRGASRDCKDTNPCTADGCDEATDRCVNDPALQNGQACNDGNACTRIDSCQNGLCTGTDLRACEPPGPCRRAMCDPVTGACTSQTVLDGTACTDGDPCTRHDECRAGQCVGTDPEVCPAGQRCGTEGTCVVDTCRGAADGTSCDDDAACTEKDECRGGRCQGRPVVCDDGNDCTQDTCDPPRGCVASPEPDGTSCDDEDACTVDEECHAGTCSAGRRKCEVEVHAEMDARGLVRAIRVDCATLDDENAGAVGLCEARAFIDGPAALTMTFRHTKSLDPKDYVGRPITKRVRRKLAPRQPRVTLVLKLNRLGRLLLARGSSSPRVAVRVHIEHGTTDITLRRLLVLLQRSR